LVEIKISKIFFYIQVSHLGCLAVTIMVKARSYKASQSQPTTAQITNYFSAVVPTTEPSKPTLHKPKAIFITKPLEKQRDIHQPTIPDDVTKRNEKRKRRRTARALARSQMEANVSETEYLNRRNNLKLECSKVYSLSIERRKRRRAVKKRKSKEKQQNSNQINTT
jgi:hypothetical protein